MITASFAADFSQFVKGTKEAEAALDKFEQETIAAGGAITSMAGKSSTAAKDVNQITSAYRQFDGALSAAGINLGPAVKGLEDIAAAAGKSATQLGTLATAGLVVGTFAAAFQSARWVIDKWFPDLDNAIATNVSKLMGWGDTAALAAQNVADTLAKASAEAGRPITNLNEAIRINTQALEDRTKKLKEQKKADEDSVEAQARVNVALQDHKAVLEAMNPLTVHAAEAALRHGASQRDVALAYKLSGSEIGAVVDKVRQHEEGIKRLNQQLEEQKKKQQEVAEITAQYWTGVGTVIDQVFGVEQLQKATTWVDAIAAMGGAVNHLRVAELEELNQTMLAGIDALARSGQLTSQQSSEFARLAVEAQAALAALRPMKDELKELAAAQWDYVTALDEEARAQQAVAQAATKANEVKGGGFQAGLVPNAIVGRNGVATDMFGRPVVPGGTLNNLPVVNISVDGHIIGTEAELARLVGSALTKSYSQGGNKLPV